MDVIGCDRFSRSRENGVLIIPRREGRGGFSSVIRFEEDGSNLHFPSPFHIRPYFSSLSLFLCRSLSLSGWFVVGKNLIRGGASHGK